jgi:MYXO-CTERM domain-containing protein
MKSLLLTRSAVLLAMFSLTTACNRAPDDSAIVSATESLSGGTCLTRSKVMFCGAANMRGTDLYTADDLTALPLTEVDGCLPDADTQAIFISRELCSTFPAYGDCSSLSGPALRTYVQSGGRIVTEWSSGQAVYNLLYGTNYGPRGSQAYSGGCSNDSMPDVILNGTNAFWTTHPIAPGGASGCGYDLAALVAGEGALVTPLGARSDGTLSVASRDDGNGLVLLVEADWSDSGAAGPASRRFLGSMATACNLCGNNVHEVGEACDDGNHADGDGCSSACLIETGIACAASGATSCASGVCDVIGQPAPGICEAAGACGNAVLDATEGCDDGNVAPADSCGATCKIESGSPCAASGDPSCESGVCDVTGQVAPGQCEPVDTCGNGRIDATDACDDGNATSGDGCSATCTIENGLACGASGNAACASGVCDVTGQIAPGVCEAADTCGNGVLDATEGCDDGNLTAADGCTDACKIETGNDCNDADPGTLAGASCESGACDLLGGAPGSCVAAGECGNGVLEPGEGCDDGAAVAGDGCDVACKIETGSACSDDAAGSTAGASCASGICNDTVGAPGLCAAPDTCGNGVLEAAEGCDDGNAVAADGCNATCLLEAGAACNGSGTGLVGDAGCETGYCDVASTVCGDRPDAGPDAGTIDAGATDGGSQDAGARDAGSPRPDAGTTADAGNPTDPTEPVPGVGLDGLSGGSGCNASGTDVGGGAWLIGLGLAFARRRRHVA